MINTKRIHLSIKCSNSYSGMLKAQKTNLVTETEYHNKEERVKVRADCFIRVYGVIYSLGCTG